MIVILETTCPSKEVAQAISSTAIKQKKAACCHIIPIRSCYMWEGELMEEGEVLLRFKTMKESVPQLVEHIKEHHPYDVPELLLTETECLSQEYLAWAKGKG